jgi:hypothetical protein
MMRLPVGTAAPLLIAPSTVDFRVGPFVVGGYTLVACLVRLPNVPVTFTSFLNQFAHHRDSPVAQLANGAELRLVLFEDGDGPVGELPFPSVRPEFWAQVDRAMSNLPAYDDHLHRSALGGLSLTADQMWDAL